MKIPFIYPSDMNAEGAYIAYATYCCRKCHSSGNGAGIKMCKEKGYVMKIIEKLAGMHPHKDMVDIASRCFLCNGSNPYIANALKSSF